MTARDNDRILSALTCIPAAEQSYIDWLRVGMALHHEGFDVSVWDSWSQNDSRYHSGECERKWKSFRKSEKPVTAGYIIYLAKQYGWSNKPKEIAWEDVIFVGDSKNTMPVLQADKLTPAQQLLTYIKTIFSEDEYVSYTTESYLDKDGKYRPKNGSNNRTAGQLIQQLEQYGDDIGAVFGDWNPAGGAWIRFNPVDGQGAADSNVTRFSYVLVESDTMPLEEQRKKIEEMNLPVACLVYSGGKSIHAIVRVDAADMEEYRQRVRFLYEHLAQHNFAVDPQNRNPSRLSRMPGITRNGKEQKLLATNIGAASWNDWLNWLEEQADDLPEFDRLGSYIDNPPTQPPEIISGVLRQGHKMIISGASKAGKSFLLMELAIAIAEGSEWLSFPCRQGQVLYLNLEIDRSSCIIRFLDIYKALGLSPQHAGNIQIWNLRGHALPADELVEILIRRMKNAPVDLVIFDPIYKIITGDENNATEMARFTNQFDKVCNEVGCAVVYAHHHSKGGQGSKKSMDRASGSGVFARDPDAIMDIIQLQLNEAQFEQRPSESATAWRLEGNLREFPDIQPVEFWFDYPIHYPDDTGVLHTVPASGSAAANLAQSSKRTTPERRHEILEEVYDACADQTVVRVSDMAKAVKKSEKTIREYIKEFSEEYINENGIVMRRKNNPA